MRPAVLARGPPDCSRLMSTGLRSTSATSLVGQEDGVVAGHQVLARPGSMIAHVAEGLAHARVDGRWKMVSRAHRVVGR